MKADDAEVPKHLWNERVLAEIPGLIPGPEHIAALDTIRGMCTLYWRRKVTRSFIRYMESKHGLDWGRRQRLDELVRSSELRQDVVAGLDCLTRTWKANWWEWLGGSQLFFWRWTEEYRLQAQDGVPIYIKGSLPCFRMPQKPPPAKHREAVKKKISKVRQRRYFWKGFVASLTQFFEVPKGEHDLRMVYDASESGLNDALWAPTFGLPTVDSLLSGLEHDTWMGDNDLGEMFLNFQLDPVIQPYCGVNVSALFPGEAGEGEVIWE